MIHLPPIEFDSEEEDEFLSAHLGKAKSKHKKERKGKEKWCNRRDDWARCRLSDFACGRHVDRRRQQVIPLANVKVCTRVCALSGLRAFARDRLHPRVVPQTSVYAPCVCNDRRPIKRNESRWTLGSGDETGSFSPR